jgi:hypothetical protein
MGDFSGNSGCYIHLGCERDHYRTKNFVQTKVEQRTKNKETNKGNTNRQRDKGNMITQRKGNDTKC